MQIQLLIESGIFATDHSKEPNICPFSESHSTCQSYRWLG